MSQAMPSFEMNPPGEQSPEPIDVPNPALAEVEKYPEPILHQVTISTAEGKMVPILAMSVTRIKEDLQELPSASSEKGQFELDKFRPHAALDIFSSLGMIDNDEATRQQFINDFSTADRSILEPDKREIVGELMEIYSSHPVMRALNMHERISPTERIKIKRVMLWLMHQNQISGQV
ncbi:MAG TPA: hypothetical protein VNE40_02430 [Candidatus Dormibacteraeota bacterium]|nr:hypothetical protein [Candidatus Dormibacteraeota bacterium]